VVVAVVSSLLCVGIDKMTEKSPATSIHSTEPVMTSASFDGGGDAGPAASNVTDDNSAVDAAATDDADDANDTSSSPAAAAAESSEPPVSSAATAISDTQAAGDIDRLKLSTLKELAVVSLHFYILYHFMTINF